MRRLFEFMKKDFCDSEIKYRLKNILSNVSKATPFSTTLTVDQCVCILSKSSGNLSKR